MLRRPSFDVYGKARRLRARRRNTEPPVPLARLLRPGVGFRRFIRDLYAEIRDDHVFMGAAALAYFLMLAIFPAAIFLLSLLPYLPIPDLQGALMDLLRQILPTQAADLFTSTVEHVVSERRGGLVSFGFLATIWAASNGLAAVMQELNVTCDVKETRPFWATRGTAILLMLLFVVLVVGAFALVVLGGVMQRRLASVIGFGSALLTLFAAFRWAVILGSLLTALAVIYTFGPNLEARFRLVSPGSVLAVLALVLSALGFRFYVENFGSYQATYGSLGAVIVLLLWLYVAGTVILIGSEVNALLDYYARNGPSAGRPLPPR